ncbi:MAG: hypothetical protein OXG25_10215 [Gammaproteobacteria bacterium]|nr:hypothetical protein [Gammaproteobacteria bacterium]
MFKNPVVLGACVLIYLHLITACSVTDTQTPINPSTSSKQSIARELIAASSTNWRDTTQPIYVGVNGDHDWLQKALVAELNAKQYLVTNDAKAGRHLAVTSRDLGANGIHVSLTLEGNQSIERVFRFEPAYAFKPPIDTVSFHETFASATSVSNKNDARVNVSSKPRLTEPKEVPLTPRTVNQPANLPRASEPQDARQCTDVVLQQGSLKRNLIRILESCGWRLSDWPADLSRPHHELDWIVPDTQMLAFESLEGLLDALRSTFDLDIELHHGLKSVRIQTRD